MGIYKKLFLFLLVFAVIFLFNLSQSNLSSSMTEECDDCPSEETSPQIQSLASGWIYFTFSGPGAVQTVNYSNSEPVDLRIGTKDCCILDDVVEKYVDGCLIGTHRSVDGIQTQYDWISLQPGNHVIELVNTSSEIHASGWYYELTSSEYTGQYLCEEIPPLESEWIYPSSATMKSNYNIILRVTNPADVSQTINFSLAKTRLTNPIISWPLNDTRVWTLDGQPYNEGNREREIGPSQTVDFIFTINHDWNWIEPWGVSRFLGIAKSLVISIPGLEELSLTLTLTETMLTFVEHVGEITYHYEGIANSQLSERNINVLVPVSKKLAFAGSVLTGIGAGKATSAGLVALATVAGAKVGAALLILEAVLIVSAEAEYAIAADPVTDFTQMAVAEPIPIPEHCIPEEGPAEEISEILSRLLGTFSAMYESYVRYDAAEDAGSLEWMVIQLELAQRYAVEAAEIMDEVGLLSVELTSPVPIPTSFEIEQIRQSIEELGLPETEQCVLTALGYTSEEIQEVETSTIQFPEDYFVNLHHLPITLGVSAEGLTTFSSSLPPHPVGATTASIDVDPDTLNKKSKGTWITVYVELPEEYNVGDINCSSLRLMSDIAPQWCDSSVGDYDGDGIADLMVKFDRKEVINALNTGHNVVSLIGTLENGVIIAGTDLIRVIDP